jgi:hypothetical protein
VFVLVHSPLVGASTWALVADELRASGEPVAVPALSDAGSGPYWQRHAESAANGLPRSSTPLVLVGHSAACTLLPAIGAAARPPVAGHVFVDGSVPLAPGDGLSRLDMLRTESSEAADQLRAVLERGGSFPQWTDADLRDEIPDAGLRAAILRDLRPRGRDFWEEPLHVPDAWSGAGCGYVELSPFYAASAAVVRRRGWAYRHVAGGHFHMLVDPAAVADAIRDVAAEL